MLFSDFYSPSPVVKVLSQKKLRIRPILVELERYYGEGCRDATSAKLKTLFEHASDLINPQPEG